MNKPNPQPPSASPLRLRKETLRTLLDDELDVVVGGTFWSGAGTDGIQCWMPSHPGGSGGGGGSISFTP
jgi:hypothetical protein